METIRVLALHGSEGDAEEFPTRLDTLKTTLSDERNVNLEITAIQAPFEKGGGYSWWKMAPGVRSFTATEYEGFDDSAEKVISAMNANAKPFDMILGHSQGAILTAALITLEKLPYHPAKGYKQKKAKAHESRATRHQEPGADPSGGI